MTIDELACKPVHWLRSTGPMSDIVISSRIRLARNVATYPFLSKANERQRSELVETIRGCLLGSADGKGWSYLDVDALDQMDGHILVERHLISRQHLDGRGDRGLALTEDESAAVMINEEDHLRIQVLRSGFQLDEVWEVIDRLDDKLEDKIDFAFHPRYGYLTACPTNVGTGIRVSVMLHLPALKLTNEIEKVLQAARDMRLAVRGLFGEGTEATGDFFQVSNQVTLGRTEQEIIDEFKHVVIPKIVDYEHRARQSLVSERTLGLDDRVWRSYGILKHARMISSEETMLHLSHLRMGINLGRLKELDLQAVNELFLVTQPAHLQKLHGMRLNGEQRGAARAEIIRRRLSKN